MRDLCAKHSSPTTIEYLAIITDSELMSVEKEIMDIVNNQKGIDKDIHLSLLFLKIIESD